MENGRREKFTVKIVKIDCSLNSKDHNLPETRVLNLKLWLVLLHIKGWWKMICSHIVTHGLHFSNQGTAQTLTIMTPSKNNRKTQNSLNPQAGDYQPCLSGLHNNLPPPSLTTPPARYLFTLTSPNLNAMSTQALCSSTILFVSSGPAVAPEGGHQIVSGIKKKGADLC